MGEFMFTKSPLNQHSAMITVVPLVGKQGAFVTD